MNDELVNDPEMVERYQCAWSLLLQGMLHWPAEQADAWAAHAMDRSVNNPFLLHEREWYAIVPLMLPPAAAALSSTARQILCDRLESALLTDLSLLDHPLDYPTWGAARGRVRGLLVDAGVAEPE